MARNSRLITHPGVVDRISGGTVFVRIASQATCGHCQAKSYCGMGESEDKLIEVRPQDYTVYAPGQHVEVTLARSLGYKALMYGYIIPFMILLVALFAMVFLTGDEALSALIAVGLMVPYYVLLYKFRDRLRRTFHFRIQPASQTEEVNSKQ